MAIYKVHMLKEIQVTAKELEGKDLADVLREKFYVSECNVVDMRYELCAVGESEIEKVDSDALKPCPFCGGAGCPFCGWRG